MRNRALIALGALAALLSLLVAVRIFTGPLSASGPHQAASQWRTEAGGSRVESLPAKSRTRAMPAEPPAWLGSGPADAAEARRERAAFTLASYLDWAQYPPTSRPARERPDRQTPHQVSARRLPLTTTDGRHTEATVVLWQSHFYLAGSEQAALTIACRRGDEPVACGVRSALASLETPAAGFEPVPLAFADDGRGADAVAGDGVLTAMFAPGEQGFAEVTGALRVALEVDAGGERGAATFALAYTASAPATFTGTVRERLDAGSLETCLELRVREPGRYVLDARVDDATGETFAFVTLNEVLAGGVQQACFRIFGKLVRDEEARAPFTLRDVEGLLLLEDAFPDRHTMATWEGRVHTTRAYAASDFSSATWESESKARYVGALRREVTDGSD